MQKHRTPRLASARPAGVIFERQASWSLTAKSNWKTLHMRNCMLIKQAMMKRVAREPPVTLGHVKRPSKITATKSATSISDEQTINQSRFFLMESSMLGFGSPVTTIASSSSALGATGVEVAEEMGWICVCRNTGAGTGICEV